MEYNNGGCITGKISQLTTDNTYIGTPVFRQEYQSIWSGVADTTIKISEVRANSMETLFNVIVITQKREILIDKKVVAKDQETAKFVAGVYELLASEKLKPSDVTVIVSSLGNVKVEDEKVK